jgi:hypothetical protein
MRILNVRRWRNRLGAIVLLGVLALNGSAFMQARSLTHFGASGSPLPSPESMSLLDTLRAVTLGVTIPPAPEYAHSRRSGLRV